MLPNALPCKARMPAAFLFDNILIMLEPSWGELAGLSFSNLKRGTFAFPPGMRPMDSVEIEYGLFECRKIGRRVLITYLAVTAEPATPSKPCLPELTAFDCDSKKECGVCDEERQRVSCQWVRCIHPGLSEQESWTE